MPMHKKLKKMDIMMRGENMPELSKKIYKNKHDVKDPDGIHDCSLYSSSLGNWVMKIYLDEVNITQEIIEAGLLKKARFAHMS